jgi:hypothetical protein
MYSVGTDLWLAKRFGDANNAILVPPATTSASGAFFATRPGAARAAPDPPEHNGRLFTIDT